MAYSPYGMRSFAAQLPDGSLSAIVILSCDYSADGTIYNHSWNNERRTMRVAKDLFVISRAAY